MGAYDLEKLMMQTRQLAVDYKEKTGQALPVCSELARFDCAHLLCLPLGDLKTKGAFLSGTGQWDGKVIQVKGRVIFDEQKQRQRIGHFNLEGEWDLVFLVLFSKEYQPSVIYQATKSAIKDSLKTPNSPNRQSRGIMSIAKFKAIGSQIWPNI